MMFEHLKRWRGIVVSGPQRSGTTICTHMIAADTGHSVIDEKEYQVHDVARWRELLEGERFVIQSPGMAHMVYSIPDDLLLVWMIRPLREIYASERNLGWVPGSSPEHANYPGLKGRIAKIKYEHSKMPANVLKVRYHSLRSHPMWVEDRADFGPKQVAPRPVKPPRRR